MLRVFVVAVAKAYLREVREGAGARQANSMPRRRCGDSSYILNDGTAIPLGDLGVGPAEYDLKPSAPLPKRIDQSQRSRLGKAKEDAALLPVAPPPNVSPCLGSAGGGRSPSTQRRDLWPWPHGGI